MDVLESILNRQSTRRYDSKKIQNDDLNKIIEAGCAAPIASAKYEKAHITVIQDEEYLDQLSNAVNVYYEKTLKPFYGASTLIVVSGKKYPSIGFGGRKWSQDNIEIANTACIIQNMALAATCLGLGSVYITGFIAGFEQSPNLLEELHLPKGFIPLGGLLVGYKHSTSARRFNKKSRIQVTMLNN